MKVILFNGPPGSGKDVAVAHLMKKYPDKFVKREYKTKLIELTKLMYDCPNELWDELQPRENKEVPHPIFEGRSPRQALIYISEEIMKPNFGQDYLSKSLVANLNHKKVNLVPDCGFPIELDSVVDKVGADNVILVRIHRPGCDFSNDSRMYVSNDKVLTYEINNNGSLESFLDGIESFLMSPALGFIE